MASPATSTVEKMLESLPETVRDRVVEHLREYLAELKDELEWDSLFKQTQPLIAAAARRARQEMAEGRVELLNCNQM